MPATTGQAKSKRTAAVSVTQGDAIRDKAAILFADDEMRPEGQRKRSDQSIAEELGISRASITRWKRDDEFKAMIQDAKSAIRAKALRLPIAQKNRRIEVLNELFEGYMAIIRIRGERHRAEREDNPGNAARAVFGDVTPAEAETGLLVAQPKIAPNGKTVVEWAFDKALVSEIRETFKHTAQELGQWVEKGEISGPGGEPLTVQLIEREDGPR